MLCDECGKNEANFIIKMMTEDGVRERSLCPECFKKYNIHQNQMGLGDIMKLFGGMRRRREEEDGEFSEYDDMTCFACGARFGDIRKNRQVGCSECYKEFAEPLKKLYPDVFSRRHTGRTPTRVYDETGVAKRIERLMRELQDAIDEENYEHAAEVRDEVRQLRERIKGGAAI